MDCAVRGTHLASERVTLWLQVGTLVRFLLTPMRATLLRRFMSCTGVVFLLQGLWSFATPLPNPVRQCTFDGGSSTYETSRAAFFVMTDSGAECADLYYANRVSTITLLALLWHRYSHVVPLTSIDQLGIVLYHDYNPNQSAPNGDPKRCK